MIKLPKLREGEGGWKMQKEKMFFLANVFWANTIKTNYP